MNVAELKSQIMSNTLQPFYIFAGEEWKVQEIYLNQIAKVTGRTIVRVEDMHEVYIRLTTTSFIKRSCIYVLRDDKDIMTNESLQNQLQSILRDDMLILYVTTLDKRLKFYKQYADSVVEFEPLNDILLTQYLQREIDLSEANISKLIDLCSHNYGECLLEIDKIQHFPDGNTDDEAFIKLVKDGTIYTPPQDAIFDFVDAVLDRKVNTAQRLYRECIACGEAVMVMLTVLYTNAKQTLQVQSCESSDIEKSTGLTYWQIKNASKHKNKYRNRELINIMDLCYQCHTSIVTGEMQEEFVMPYILVSVM